MKTILVPTDFSEYAFHALKVAGRIAKKINGRLDLVHVYHQLPAMGEDQSYYFVNEYYEEIIADANKKLDYLFHQSFLSDVDVKCHVISSATLWEIVKNNKLKNPDLIVMGAHGTNGDDFSFIGSNTEKMVRLSDSPVLTIKNEIKEFKVNKMVFASNFLDESYQSFKKIKFFADLYHAHIYLLKVITPKDFETTPQSQKLLHDFSKKFKLKNCSLNTYNDHDIENGIINFSHEKDADLIAIETHGRTGFAHLINGSLAEDVVKHEAKPVLSVKMQKPLKHPKKMADSKLSYQSWGAE